MNSATAKQQKTDKETKWATRFYFFCTGTGTLGLRFNIYYVHGPLVPTFYIYTVIMAIKIDFHPKKLDTAGVSAVSIHNQ